MSGEVKKEAPAPEGGAVDDDYDLGKRDGYEEAVQDIDLLTGGDGEYVFATNGGGCPDPEAMKSRIADRFAALATREEAPAEAGEIEAARARMFGGMIEVSNYGGLDSPQETFMADLRTLLRAQPPARSGEGQ